MQRLLQDTTSYMAPDGRQGGERGMDGPRDLGMGAFPGGPGMGPRRGGPGLGPRTDGPGFPGYGGHPGGPDLGPDVDLFSGRHRGRRRRGGF